MDLGNKKYERTTELKLYHSFEEKQQMIKQLKYFSIVLIVIFTASCKGQNEPKSPSSNNNDREILIDKRPNPQNRDDRDIVTNGLLDKDGNVWFGGRYGILFRYDGQELKDFSQLKRNK